MKIGITFRRVFDSSLRNAQYFEGRRFAFAIVAIVGFPAYYFVWHDLIPQPYENLPLRLLGSLLFLPVAFAKYWPRSWRKYLPAYWYVVLLFALPFFFSFMLLKNNSSEVWVESMLVAIFVMVVVLDWFMLIVHFILGIALGWLAYVQTTHVPTVPQDMLPHLPVVIFAVLIGTVANYATEVVRLEQERAMMATAGYIAHELRTPLLGIKSGALGLIKFLPELISGYLRAKEAGLDVKPIREVHLADLRKVLARIESEADYSNAIIEILIANVRLDSIRLDDWHNCSMQDCINEAVRRYPFAQGEREKLSIAPELDFQFKGSRLLMVHVLFNLIKNALRHIRYAQKGQITISYIKGQVSNKLIFRDSGPGIDPEVLPHIFKRFYSSSAESSMIGSGIGLAFCKDVLGAFGGA